MSTRGPIALAALAAVMMIACESAEAVTPEAATTPTPESGRTAGMVTSTPTAIPAPEVVTPTPPAPGVDREALVALYHATNGDSWSDNSNWLSDAPIGEWYGVEVDEDGRVVALYLGGLSLPSGLSGEIPPELGNLAKLEALFIYANLVGEIPAELGNLTNLESLGLQDNQLSGEIPPELGNLASLEFLGLSNNQLTGELPPDLCRLEFIGVLGNELTIRGWALPNWLPAWSFCDLLRTDDKIDPEVWLEEQLAKDEKLALWAPTSPPRNPALD